MRVHHIALLTAQVDRLARFYRDLLACEELGRHHDDRGLRSVWLPLGDAILMVERLEAPAERERGAGGWHMLVLDIPAAERARWVKRLEAAGAGPTGSTGFTLYGQDPDGNPFGLSHYPEPAPE